MSKVSGLRRYYGSEAGNVLLGQLGFDILRGDGSKDDIIEAGLDVGEMTAFGVVATDNGIYAKCWTCIQHLAPVSGETTVSVKTAIGDDWTELKSTDATKIYGVFTAVKLHLLGAAGDFLICYRG